MRNNKRGISPLIATVLVIGFTIVLAAMVITWGTRLFQTTVEETEAESKFTLACTTGLKVDVVKRNLADDFSTLSVTLKNTNQQQDVEDFVTVLNFADGSERGVASGPISEVTNEPDNSLIFPVPKEYTISLEEGNTRGTLENLESVDLYPQFTIDGNTRNCENSVRVNV